MHNKKNFHDSNFYKSGISSEIYGTASKKETSPEALLSFLNLFSVKLQACSCFLWYRCFPTEFWLIFRYSFFSSNSKRLLLEFLQKFYRNIDYDFRLEKIRSFLFLLLKFAWLNFSELVITILHKVYWLVPELNPSKHNQKGCICAMASLKCI